MVLHEHLLRQPVEEVLFYGLTDLSHEDRMRL